MAICNIRDKIDGNELDLSMMSLKEVPLKEISSVPRATVLDLSSNQLKLLPSSFGFKLSHLVKLDLSVNKLQSLPKSFHQLINLKHLDLYNNQLTDLPASLHHLVKLRFLDIKNNPLNPALKIVVGDCLTSKECENAAKKLVLHFTKEKQLAIEQDKMANKSKVEDQRRDESEAVRSRTDKKVNKKDRKNEKPVKQQDNNQQKSSATNARNGAAAGRAQKPTLKAKSSGGWCSCVGWLNSLLMIAVVSAAAWCVHLHCEGDYSEKGLKKALPKMQESFYKLKNVTLDALQPHNIRSTGNIVFLRANSSMYEAASAVQKAAYAGQTYLEVYTGDLSPYTTKVTQAAKNSYNWLYNQDWQGMWGATIVFFADLWLKIQDLWAAALKNPTVAATWAAVCHYASLAAAYVVFAINFVIQYLQENAPIWLDIVKVNTNNAITTIKSSVQSMIK